MTLFDSYGQYYDLLYADKAYEAEAKAVRDLLRSHAPEAGTLLEFGAGTGRHARLLAGLGYDVTAVERSSAMLQRATVAAGVGYINADIREVDLGRRFDAVVSLFHVVSYQSTDQDVLATFSRAADHLGSGGLFVFDFWYTPAVLHNHPANRTKTVRTDSLEVVRTAVPHHDFAANCVDVNYTMVVTHRDGAVRRFSETHRMRYFDLPEIDGFASKTGFVRIEAHELTTGAAPSPDTWGICAVLRKTS
jgi:SAM-dependent methyltransferase